MPENSTGAGRPTPFAPFRGIGATAASAAAELQRIEIAARSQAVTAQAFQAFQRMGQEVAAQLRVAIEAAVNDPLFREWARWKSIIESKSDDRGRGAALSELVRDFPLSVLSWELRRLIQPYDREGALFLACREVTASPGWKEMYLDDFRDAVWKLCRYHLRKELAARLPMGRAVARTAQVREPRFDLPGDEQDHPPKPKLFWPSPSSEPSPIPLTEARLDDRRLLLTLVPRLAPQEREVLRLTLSDVPDSEIAQRLGIEPATLRVLWFRIKKKAADSISM